MLNEVIAGVSVALHECFAGRYRAFANDVAQGLCPPCFFISALEPETKPLLGRRAMAYHPLDVRFIPEDGGQNTALFAMAAELAEILSFITLPNGTLVRGTGMRYETADGVLHFFVSYNFPVLFPEKDPAPALETLRMRVQRTKDDA